MALLHQSPQCATGLIAVGSGAGMRYFIDSSTIRHDASLLRYRLLGQSLLPHVHSTFTGEVGVDCSLRARIEYLSILTSNGRSTTTSAASAELKPVFEGTRLAEELTVACNVAIGSTAPPNSPTEIKPLPGVPAQIPSPTPSSAAVSKPKSSGTGFAISTEGIVITNHHVVGNCASVQGLVNDRLHDASVVAVDEANDLAAVRIASQRIPALTLATNQLELGSTITVLGYPLASVLGTDLKATTGIVSSLSGIRGERRNMQISAAVQPGNSGGPVLDDRGAVAGVVVAKLSSKFTAENVNFAIRGPLLRSFLEINNIDFLSSTLSRPLAISEIVKKAAPSTILIFCY